MSNRVFKVASSLTVVLVAACGSQNGGRGASNGKDTVLVFVAASLTNAIRPQLDSFSAKTGTTVLIESGGSMEHVRKMMELHRIPDLILLADDEIFPQTLAPNYVTWWADFARNRMVVAYTDRSRAHDSITDANWFSILARPGVEVGRADPKLAPVGARTLILFTLAELAYKQPGLANRLVANAPDKNVRANAAELAALLAAGELDYIYDYESVARAQGFRYVVMPPQITGRPITYALSIPTNAPHKSAGEAALEYLESPTSLAALRASYIDMLDAPSPHGTGAPSFMTRQ